MPQPPRGGTILTEVQTRHHRHFTQYGEVERWRGGEVDSVETSSRRRVSNIQPWLGLGPGNNPRGQLIQWPPVGATLSDPGQGLQ
jgi:hypothetical protein